jgi:simple sugar transport system permease protein
VKLVRLEVAIIAGLLAGSAGAYLFLSKTGTWSANVALGWGWLALGTVILGYWHPIGVALASYLVGITNTLTLILGAHGIPPALAENIPYMVVMAALVIVSWIYEKLGVRPPAAIWKR